MVVVFTESAGFIVLILIVFAFARPVFKFGFRVKS